MSANRVVPQRSTARSLVAAGGPLEALSHKCMHLFDAELASLSIPATVLYNEIDVHHGFAMVKTPPPRFLLGKRLGETTLRTQHRVTVVAIKRTGEAFTYATEQTLVSPGDTIIVSGQIRDAERFSELT